MNIFRSKAIRLRNLGYSYGMIRDKLTISKSTLSNWLSNLPYKPNKKVRERIGQARVKSSLYRHKLKIQDITQREKEAAKEIGNLTPRDLLMLGIGVYLGEGSKSNEEIRIANSNPIIIKLTLRWLRNFCGLQNHHFRMTVHSYPDINHREAIRFWSKETAIPITQFTKTVIDRRENKSKMKRGKLPYGTVQLYVRGGGTLSPGVKSLHRKIMGWVKNIEKQI